MNPEEVQAAFEAFALLEPEVQKGIAALIHKIHGQPETAQDFLAAAQTLINSQSPKGN